MRTRQRPRDYYRGSPMVESDLIKELVFATLAIAVLALILAIVFSSPDEPPLTVKRTAHENPLSFAQNALAYLDGTSDISNYGPPYNNKSGSVQSLGPIAPQKWAGVQVPINPARDFVLNPLRTMAKSDPRIANALKTYSTADASQRARWEANLQKGLSAKGTRVVDGKLKVARGAYGPVLAMINGELRLGLDGALDSLLLGSSKFYQADYTRPLLFISSSEALNKLANSYNLQGDQWGVMNETGNWPGQAWLWLYTLLYQIPPYTTVWEANADLAAILTIGVLSLLLLLVPWIPGLRDIPRWLRVYRIIWRDHYRRVEGRRRERPS
jgi:hypothetical protein